MKYEHFLKWHSKLVKSRKVYHLYRSEKKPTPMILSPIMEPEKRVLGCFVGVPLLRRPNNGKESYPLPAPRPMFSADFHNPTQKDGVPGHL